MEAVIRFCGEAYGKGLCEELEYTKNPGYCLDSCSQLDAQSAEFSWVGYLTAIFAI